MLTRSMNNFRFIDRNKQNTTGKTGRSKNKVSKTFKIGINWTKSAIALALLCAVFSFSALAQKNLNQSLDAAAASALIQELSDGLPDVIKDEDAVTTITDKWDEREDLAGKTRTHILGMLFADVKSVIRDAETQKNIWDAWTGEGDQIKTEEEKDGEDGSTEGDQKQAEEDEDDEHWSAMDASRKLNAQDVSWMQEDFEDELSDYIDDQAQIAAIVKKWNARKDLAGKTKAAVTALLFADVRSVVNDKETLGDIQDSWKVADAVTGTTQTK